MPPEIQEIKNIIDPLARAFEEYKAANDQRLAEIAKKGSADPVLNEKVSRLDEALATMQKSVDDGNKALKSKLDDVEKLAARPAAAVGAENPEAKKQAQEFLTKLRKGDGKNTQIQFEHKDGDVVSDPAGGYYVAPTFVNRIIERVFETTDMRGLCTTMTTEGDSVEFLANTNDITANWVGEVQTRSKTTATAPSMLRIPTRELEAMPALSQKLLDDNGFNLESYLVNKIADVMGRKENAAFISGDGVLQPRGITTYSTTATDDATRAWGVMQYVPVGYTSVAAWIAGTNPGDVLLTLIYKLKTAHLKGASWLIPRPVLTGVRQLHNSVGGYLWQPSYQAGQPATLLDYPVTIAPDMPAVASGSLSAAFGNFKEGYTILDRVGIRMLRDPFTNKPFVNFYTTKRVGGDVTDFEAIKFLKFSAS